MYGCFFHVFQEYQNHSDPKLGTENTPQWIKIPNLASSYQSGSGCVSNESRVGLYLPATTVNNNMATVLNSKRCSIVILVSTWEVSVFKLSISYSNPLIDRAGLAAPVQWLVYIQNACHTINTRIKLLNRSEARKFKSVGRDGFHVRIATIVSDQIFFYSTIFISHVKGFRWLLKLECCTWISKFPVLVLQFF